MSQQLISQKVQRTCEGCGAVKEFELVGISPETTDEMLAWYTIVREVFDPEQGRLVKIAVQACTLACVPPAAVKLALPPITDQSPEQEIDLKSLRVGANDPTIN